ncbi:MAG: hypothetical protein WC044_02670 [Crocinitomicaceae bacterium]
MKERFRFRDTVTVDRYEIEKNGFKALKLKVDVANYRILNTKDVDFLSQQTITQIDLVYTDFPAGEDFTELTRKRLLEFYIHFPETMNSSVIEWRIVKQTGPKSASSVGNYFHGFVVYYREMPSIEEEKRLIMVQVEKNQMTDSSVYKILERNRTWKNTLVVCDVTGSMAPYTLQILIWLKANAKLNTFDQVVFFNDDEEKSNDQTSKLDTAGIWDIESKNGRKVVDLAIEAMKNGNHIENNLEAVCYAINKYPNNLSNIVMIADNWENPCDMELLNFLKKKGAKIHVVVCGVTDRLNTVYLDIAYATGGSVHTMEQDLEITSNMGDGRTINLGDMKFKMVGGAFTQIK